MSFSLLLYTLLEFFTSALTDGLTLEFEWQQVSSSLQDSSQDSAALSNAVVRIVSTRPPISKSSRPFNNSFCYCAKRTNHNWHNRYFHVPQLFQFSSNSKFLSFFSLSFRFILWSAGTAKSTILQIFSFFVDYYEVWSSGRDQVIRLYVKVP